MDYYDLVLSGKTAKLTISSGDNAYNTKVRNSASLKILAGGYVENTTVLASVTVSNAGSARSTYLSGGTMIAYRGAVVENIEIGRNARLAVSAGGRATGVSVGLSGNVNAEVLGGDTATLIEGVNESGVFGLANGVASNFVLNSLGRLTVSNGGIARDIDIRFGGYFTVMSGGSASGISQRAGGYVRADVYGNDSKTTVYGVNASGDFSLAGGVASNFILYDGGAQQIFNGGTALHTLVSGQRAIQYVWSNGVVSATSVFKNGLVNIYDGGIARDTFVYSGGSMVTNDGALVSGARVEGTLYVDSGSTGEGETGGSARISDVDVAPTGTLNIVKQAVFSGDISISGTLRVGAGVTVNDLTVSSTGKAVVSGVFNVAGSTWNTSVCSRGRMTAAAGTLLAGLSIDSGGRLDIASGEAVTLAGGGNIASGTVYLAGAQLGIAASGGVITGLGSTDAVYDLAIGGGFSASGAVVGSGAVLRLADGDAALEDTVLAAGGSLALVSGARTGDRLLFDFTDTPAGGTAFINDLALLSPRTKLHLRGTADGGAYVIAPDGGENLRIRCLASGLYEGEIAPGESLANAFTGMEHRFSSDGSTVTASAFTVATAASAAALDDTATRLNADDRAVKWDEATGASGTIELVASGTTLGEAWLELDGADLSGTTLFGAAAGASARAVSLLATSGAVLGNVAAGAAAGGKVGSVRFTADSATLGLTYAGGFGTVENDIGLRIAGGSTTKDVYAGALANYNKTGIATSAGNIAFEIAGGEFGENTNIYGGAAVKAGTVVSELDSPLHRVGDINVCVTGGTSLKSDLCLFAGGYATGSYGAGGGGAVYTVDSVTATVADGSWGEVRAGRGVFGGIFASGVEAEVADGVSITITGGSFGNIYGGGWAQKGGVSVAGSVDITIAGGTIANVCGGGATSTSGGATRVGDVAITIAGGSIGGMICARGRGASDAVTGSATVTFTGANDYDCDVFGYGYVEGEENSDALEFADFTGTLTGAVGGFNRIDIAGDTQLTLDIAEGKSVSNNAWDFDFAERDGALAAAAALNWRAQRLDEDFRIVLNFADSDQARLGWSLAAVAGVGDTLFDLSLDGTVVAEELRLGDRIADGDLAGWGFKLDKGVLKFAKLS